MATKYGEDIAVLKSQIIDVQKALERIETKIDGQEEKFAAKWVQQVVGGLIALVLLAVFTALIALVVIPAAKQTSVGPSTPTTTPTTRSVTETSPSTPGDQGSTSSTSSANAHSDAAKPNSSESNTSGGGLGITLPKL